MKLSIILSFILSVNIANAADWQTADFTLDGSLLDFAQAQRYPSFHLNGVGWVRTFGSGSSQGKIVVKGQNHNCDSVGKAYHLATGVNLYYCFFTIDRFTEVIVNNAEKGERFEESISTMGSYFSKISDQRIMILIGHDSTGIESYSIDFLDPKTQALQTDLVSTATSLKPF